LTTNNINESRPLIVNREPKTATIITTTSTVLLPRQPQPPQSLTHRLLTQSIVQSWTENLRMVSSVAKPILHSRTGFDQRAAKGYHIVYKHTGTIIDNQKYEQIQWKLVYEPTGQNLFWV
jgi:hypothetical protein